MVFTRSRKRGNDDDEDDTEFVVVREAKRQKTGNDGETQSDSESSGDECLIVSDDDESTNRTSETSETSKTSEESETKVQKVLNLRLNQTQVQHIIKEAIQQLMKKFDQEDMEFIPNKKETDDDTQEYDKFLRYIDSIHSGDFFQRIPVEARKKRLVGHCSVDEMRELNKELEELQKLYKETAPSIIDVLKLDIHAGQKQKLLEKMYHYMNAEVLTGEYNATLKQIMTSINKTTDAEMFKLEQEIMKSAQSDEYSDDYRQKILKSKMPFENKVIAYKRLEVMERYEDSDSSEYAKYKNWMDLLLSVPFGQYIQTPSVGEMSVDESTKYLQNVREVLDSRLSFLEKPKDQIINIVTQMIRNPDASINAIGLHGPKGLGKCLAKNTPVLMYDGNIKKIQDVQCGDIIMGDDSTPRLVMSLAQGREEMFEVKHKNTGQTYTVNKSHILSLRMNKKHRLIHLPNKKMFVVNWFDMSKKMMTKTFGYDFKSEARAVCSRAKKFLKTVDGDGVINICVADYLQIPEKWRSHLHGYTTAVDFPSRDVPFDAYTVGYWVGAGVDSNKTVRIKDAKVLAHVVNVLTERNAYLWCTARNRFRIVGQDTAWHSIPNDIKINDKQTREQCLAGIIDAIGSSCGNRYIIRHTNKALIDDIKFMSESLGCIVRVDKSMWDKNVIKLHISGYVFPTQRVKVKFSVGVSKKTMCNTSQIKLVSKGEGDYYGFEIDGNKRFVLGNFIVTHNTSIVKSIAEALNRPYRCISLGGESDASMLTGHGFTYVGSTPGRLIELLSETKCMNPVILIDELDKVSQTHHGKEIIGNLIHLTDSTTNAKYNYDRYFAGVDFDLSKVLFVFTYNDTSKVDRILADRIVKIAVDNYSFEEKLEITKKHLIANILSQFGFSNSDVMIDDDAIRYVVQSSKGDEGMRGVKNKFEIIISRVNTLLLTQSNNSIVKLKYKKLSEEYKCLPVTIKKEHIDVFLEDSTTDDKLKDPPMGMYT